MAITTALVGKLGGGASWTTQTFGPVTAKGNFTNTDIATIAAPSSGKTKIGILKLSYTRQGGYPSGMGVSVRIASTTYSDGSIYGDWESASSSLSGAVFQVSASDTVQVVTQSGTGSVLISGTIEWLEK